MVIVRCGVLDVRVGDPMLARRRMDLEVGDGGGEPVICHERTDDYPAYRGEDHVSLHRLHAADLPGIACGLVKRSLGGAAVHTDEDGLVLEPGGRSRVAPDYLQNVF
jgi:hypothetical protein